MKFLSNFPKYAISSLNRAIHLFIFIPATYFTIVEVLVIILHPRNEMVQICTVYYFHSS